MTWHAALLAVSVLTAFLALGMTLWCLSRMLYLQSRVASQEDQALSLRGALSAISEDGLRERQRGLELEQRVRQISEYQQQLTMRDPEQGPYHHALRLAGRGASAEELVRDCGLTRGEAELVLALHRPDDSASAEASEPPGRI